MLYKCLLTLFFITFIEAHYSQYRSQTCVPLSLDHGRVRPKTRAKLVKFMCSLRYELVGNRYATCRNGEWDVPKPVCVKPGCPALPPSPNAIQMKQHHDAWVITFCMPGYRMEGPSAIYCNGYKWNATAPQCISTTLLSSLLSCDFEEPSLCGWKQDELHDFDWSRHNKKTPSSFMETGPTYDHTLGEGKNGYYMYIESTSKQDNDTARLISPIYDWNLANNGCFTFYYHMYGKGIGGLRVYQKPDNLQLSDLLAMKEQDKASYILFEQWGNQGDTWLSAAPQLVNMEANIDFQIVIEGIRGVSFTSDIAIDDVAILQGENCTDFRNEANATPIPPRESCAGSCFEASTQAASCDCTLSCVVESNCCPDFMELCVFNTNSTSSTEQDDPSDEQPQTDKLVAISSTTTPETTTPTTTPATVKTTQTTKPTTVITKPTTKVTTTAKPTPKTTTKITTPSQRDVTTRKLTTKSLVSTSTMTTTKKVVSTDEMKREKEMSIQKIQTSDSKKDNQVQAEPSKWKTPLITIVILSLFASLLYLAVYSRTANGRAALARLRGRTSSHDSEVRYLTSDHDDL